MNRGSDLPAPLDVPNTGRWLGSDGSWSTFYVHVGSPPQYFYVYPSFSGQSLYVPIDKDCERMNTTDCGSQRGVEIFQAQPSPGFQKNQSSTWSELGIYTVGLGTNLGLVGNAYYGYDNFGLGGSSSSNTTELAKLAVAAYATPDLWVGRLGLSMYEIIVGETVRPHSLLSRFKEEGKIASLSFGYQAGAPHRYTKVLGSLILGGYDRSRHSNKTLLVPSTTGLGVGLQGINLTFGNGTSTNLLSNGIISAIDTDTPDLWLPRPVCDALASTLGLTYFEKADRYVLTDSARSALRASSPTFAFTIGTSASGGTNITINIPYTAFDLQAGYPTFGTMTNYFPLRRAANDSQYTLGRAFLQEVYLSVDWEREVFNISQAVFSSPPLERDIVIIRPKNGTNDLVSQSVHKTALSVGAIAGIAIGATLLVVLLAGLAWWLYRRKQRAKETEVSQILPMEDEKEGPHNFDSGSISKGPFGPRNDVELEGRMVEEMYAPHGHHEMHESNKQPEQSTEVFEADSRSPIYELPSPDLPAPREHV